MDHRTHLALGPDGAGDPSPPVTPVAGPHDGPATAASPRPVTTIGTAMTTVALPDEASEVAGVDDYQLRLGARLRAVRRARELRLQDVEERSGGRFKAVVVGSYERGDRAVSAPKLAALAAFYDVPVAELLPDDGWTRTPAVGAGSLRLAVDQLRARADEPDVAPVARLVDHIRGLRGDHHGRVLTVRADDLRTAAVALGLAIEDLPTWLDARGLLAHR